MNDKPVPLQPAAGLSLADIYYVLFRHKWKIVSISGAGLLAALLVPLFWSRPYQSEAKLFIRYVLENRSPNQLNQADSKVKTPDERGENVINTELEILTSLDLALDVAERVGPDKILATYGGGTNLQQAAGVIRRNLLPEVPKRSNVIRLVFQHPDQTVVQPVLNKLIDLYLTKHAEIHRAVGVFDDFLTLETESLRANLGATEDSLRQAKTNANIISLDDSKKLFSEQLGKIQQAIFDAEAELAERQAAVTELSKLMPEELPRDTNSHLSAISSETNTSVASVTETTNAAVALSQAVVPPDKLAQYKRNSAMLENLSKREQDLLVQFTPETSLVRSVRTQILEAEKLKQQLESEYPTLLAVKVTETKIAIEKDNPRVLLIAERTRVSSLNSKIKVLNLQLAQIRNSAATVDQVEGAITSLQRKKDLQEAQYKYFQANLEQTQIDKKLGASRTSNISVIQVASPAFRDNSKLQKVMAMLFFGGLAAALGLAFLVELYFDHSIRRPNEIESKLGLPLFVTIPRMVLNGKSRLPLLAERNHNHSSKPEELSATAAGQQIEIALPADRSLEPSGRVSDVIHHPISPSGAKALHPFYEALRDRLILYFELKNLTHKPKLVAVTSCATGSGVSTTASGLAATLSETGDGNVLLVDMNFHGEARQFCHGKLACDLEDALESDKRGNALVQENLYVVSETGNGDKLPRVLPKRFKHLVPKLKASDYDYIIFDLPPISQISATTRLARFMDMVFVVVESEKTALDAVKRATGLLAESTSNVGIILNKTRSYIPKQLKTINEMVNQ